MYTITPERADELMRMLLTVQSECEHIMASLGDKKATDRIECIERIEDALYHDGLEGAYMAAEGIRVDARLHHRTSTTVFMRTVEWYLDTLSRGVER